MSLIARVNELATAVANHLRDQVAPRLTPTGGAVGQVVARGPGNTLVWQSKLVVSEVDSDATGSYYGGVAGGAWQINKYVNGVFVGKASILNNSAIATLQIAWANRSTLVY